MRYFNMLLTALASALCATYLVLYEQNGKLSP
jgi:hypothetical protein